MAVILKTLSSLWFLSVLVLQLSAQTSIVSLRGSSADVYAGFDLFTVREEDEGEAWRWSVKLRNIITKSFKALKPTNIFSLDSAVSKPLQCPPNYWLMKSWDVWFGALDERSVCVQVIRMSEALVQVKNLGVLLLLRLLLLLRAAVRSIWMWSHNSDWKSSWHLSQWSSGCLHVLQQHTYVLHVVVCVRVIDFGVVSCVWSSHGCSLTGAGRLLSGGLLPAQRWPPAGKISAASGLLHLRPPRLRDLLHPLPTGM